VGGISGRSAVSVALPVLRAVPVRPGAPPGPARRCPWPLLRGLDRL
jgi:hypothetical protein